MNETLGKIANYIVPFITFVIGLIVEYYFYLFKNKLPKIRYTINKTVLGISQLDSPYGKVQVLYNDYPVQNLYTCQIEIVNSSNNDFGDLEMMIWCDLDSMILMPFARKTDTVNALQLTDKYSKEIQDMNEANAHLLWTKRPYYIPVFNRDDKIVFSCLVTNSKGIEPLIYLDCDHPGLKVEAKFFQPQLLWGENINAAALWGVLISGILIIPLIYFLNSKILLGSLALFLGVFCAIWGVVVLKAFKTIRKIFR